MAGIYIHVPFCKTRCIYCDFYSNTGLIHTSFLDALSQEIALRKDYFEGEPIDTIYFGGGTPSQLSVDSIRRILDRLMETFPLSSNPEITLEANPDDLDEAYVDGLSRLAFNRLSMGVQTFDDAGLKFLRRRHSARQAVEAVKRCQDAGFANISIDLMYGLPNQTLDGFASNIEVALGLDVQHISAYHLIYEQGTKLFRMKQDGEVMPVDEDLSVEMFSLLIKKLAEGGFEHYEISNFAKNGQYSRHNTSYWTGEKYLGLGPSAHSFNGQERQWNIASLNKYVLGMKNGNPNVEIETETPTTRYNEFVLTGLRTMWGVDLERLELEFGEQKRTYFLKNAEKHLKSGMLVPDGQQMKLSKKGIFVSDGIMSDLMWVE